MNSPKNKDGKTEVMDVVGLPELHLYLGPGNDNWKLLEKKCPEIMNLLQSKLNIQKSEYQGKKKNGRKEYNRRFYTKK